MSSWRVGAAVVVSLLLHASPTLVAAARSALREAEPLHAESGLAPRWDAPGSEAEHPAPRRPAEALARDRKALVEEARAAKRAGTLHLGDFLLRAAALDAEELGQPLDVDEARKRYDAGLAKVRSELSGDQDIVSILRAAYGDMQYHGRGGSMADALLEGGGLCEQLAHLFAATMYDADLAPWAFIRLWGGGDGGHLAPIYLYVDGTETDVVAGGPPGAGGVRFPADELVEIYARKHGLAPRLPKGGSSRQRFSDGRATFAGGYPPNGDAYPGLVPLFVQSALGYGGGAAIAEPEIDDPYLDHCPLYAHTTLFPSTVGIIPDEGEPYAVEHLRSREPPEVESDAYAIARLEVRERRMTGVSRMLANACLSVMYEELASSLAMIGRPALVKEAVSRARGWRGAATGMFSAIPWTTALRQELAQHQDGWLVTQIPGSGAVAVQALADLGELHDSASGYMSTGGFFLALLVDESTRAPALLAFNGLPMMVQFVISQDAIDRGEHMRKFLGDDHELVRVQLAFERMFALITADPAVWSSYSEASLAKFAERAGMPPRFVDAFYRSQEIMPK